MLELDRSLTDFNYYYFYLLQYLQLNKYQVDPDHPQIITNSIAALDAFENARRNGANVPMAEAEAISQCCSLKEFQGRKSDHGFCALYKI